MTKIEVWGSIFQFVEKHIWDIHPKCFELTSTTEGIGDHEPFH